MAPHGTQGGPTTRADLVVYLDRRASSSKGDALILLQIDDLERLDEAYGGRCREAVYRIVGTRLRAVVRAVDLIARFDDGEFAVLCGDCGVDEAMVVADRLRSAATEPLSVGSNRLGVSVSVGVAHHADAAPGGQLLERAEAALGRAMSEGRNRVELAEPVD